MDSISVCKIIHYRNIYLFIEYTMDLTYTKISTIVYTNLYSFLRSKILVSLTTSLYNIENDDPNIEDNWVK